MDEIKCSCCSKTIDIENDDFVMARKAGATMYYCKDDWSAVENFMNNYWEIISISPEQSYMAQLQAKREKCLNLYDKFIEIQKQY